MADGDTFSLLPSSYNSNSRFNPGSYNVNTATPSSGSTASEAYGNAVANSATESGNNWKNNPNYQLTITDEGTKTSVVCQLPEETRFRLQNQWEPILNLFNGIAQKGQDLVALTGLSANIKALTTKIWRHSEPLTFDFKLEFDAKDDVMKDVLTPVTNLIKMAAPSRGSGALGDFILVAPGPSLADGLLGMNRRISLRIGKMLFLDSVIINSLDINMPSAFDAQGNPISMDCDISLETWYTPDKDDIAKFFEYGKTGNNSMIYNPFTSEAGKAISKISEGYNSLFTGG
jgi:hypothetical protein